MHQVVLFKMINERYSFAKDNVMGNLFMNRFAIEEDANFEILKIFQVDDFYDEDPDDLQIDYEKGKGLMNPKL